MARKIAPEIIVVLLFILWIYAAISKLADYTNFVVQLSKSPMLNGFAGMTAILVPASELLIAAALILDKYRLIGLYGSFFLLMMFSAYLIAILKFSFYVPCSCGGILNGLSWNAHVLFNLGFAALALFAIVLITKQRKGASRQDASIYK